MIKRITLFAGYDDQRIIDDYVIYYIKKLSEISDVYYLADCEMETLQLEKLKSYTISAWAFRHEKYDFGSWQEIIKKIGWSKIAEYDELILANDSCFGPLFDLNNIFEKQGSVNTDFWGMTKSYEVKPHLQSFFMVFRKNVFNDSLFQNFFNGIKIQNSWWDVISNYELKLTELLHEKGFSYSFVYENKINPTFFYRTMIRNGIPLVKMKVIKDKNYAHENPFLLKATIRRHSEYDLKLLDNYILRYNIDISMSGYIKNILPGRMKIALKKVLRIMRIR